MPPQETPTPLDSPDPSPASSLASGMDALARWISIVAHPFVLILLYVLAGAASRLELAKAMVAAAAVLVGGILPLTLFLLRGVRVGDSNFDVSAREQRGPVYVLGLALGLGLLAVFATLGAPADLLAGMICGIVLVLLASLINFWLKVSLHVAFAVWVAVGFITVAPWASGILLVLAALVVWSRLRLDRHTLGEVVAGIVLGAGMAMPMLLLFAG